PSRTRQRAALRPPPAFAAGGRSHRVAASLVGAASGRENRPPRSPFQPRKPGHPPPRPDDGTTRRSGAATRAALKWHPAFSAVYASTLLHLPCSYIRPRVGFSSAVAQVRPRAESLEAMIALPPDPAWIKVVWWA